MGSAHARRGAQPPGPPFVFLTALLSLFFLSAAPVYAERREVLRSPYDAAVASAYAPFDLRGPDLARDSGVKIIGGIAPHHDVAIEMILRFYAAVRENREVRRVFLFAPDHFRQVRRWAAVCPADWAHFADLPGVLSADFEAVSILGGSSFVEMRPEIFEKEHGITLHIPLVARFFPGATVVPILLRPDIPDIALLSLRKRLAGIMREGDMIILSMDLSHYKTPAGLHAEDDRTIPVLTQMRHAELRGLDIDAPRAAALALLLLRDLGAKSGTLLERTDTSEVSGEFIESGTSYATIVYGFSLF